MAVYEKLSKIKEFYGLSTDTKPTTVVGTGHLFTETNTGQVFIWDGTSWVEDLRVIYSVYEALQ